MAEPEVELNVLRPVERDRRVLTASAPHPLFELRLGSRADREAELAVQQRWTAARGQLLFELAGDVRPRGGLGGWPVFAVALLVEGVVGVDDSPPYER